MTYAKENKNSASIIVISCGGNMFKYLIYLN